MLFLEGKDYEPTNWRTTTNICPRDKQNNRKTKKEEGSDFFGVKKRRENTSFIIRKGSGYIDKV